MKKISLILFSILIPFTVMAVQENFFAKFGVNMRAYFNTFYNAKVYFSDAQEAYDNEEDKTQLQTETRVALNKASQQAETVIRKFPQSSYVDDAMFFSSVCQFQLGRYELALKQLEDLTLRYPGSLYYYEAKLWISKCYFQMDKKTIAYDLIEQFLSNNSNRGYFTDAYSLKGYLALQEQDSSRALNAFLQAADYASDKEPRCNMYLEAVSLLIDRGEYEDALKYTDRASRNIKFDEQRARVEIAYIRIFRLMGDEQKANNQIAEALKDARIAKYCGDIIYEQANIDFKDGNIREGVSKFKYVVDDPEKTFRNNRDSKAWARAAYRLGEYYIYDKTNVDSSEFFMKKAQTKRKQGIEGELASEYLEKLKQLKQITAKIDRIIGQSAQLSDSAWVYFGTLSDSVETEFIAREMLLNDTLTLDSAGVDSVKMIAKTQYHNFEVMLSEYLEKSNQYVGELFSLAGLFLFDLNMPDTALKIYTRIEKEFYYTNSVPQALYSQSYVWEYDLDNKPKADSIKQEITFQFPTSELSNYILGRIPQDSLQYYKNQQKIYDIETGLIDQGEYTKALSALKELLRSNTLDRKSHAFVAFKIAWLYDYELSRTGNTQDSTLFYYHLVDSRHPGTPLARQSALRISRIETDIKDYIAYLAGDSLQTGTTKADSGDYASGDQNGDEEKHRQQHPIYRRLKSPGRPRPARL